MAEGKEVVRIIPIPKCLKEERRKLFGETGISMEKALCLIAKDLFRLFGTTKGYINDSVLYR